MVGCGGLGQRIASNDKMGRVELEPSIASLWDVARAGVMAEDSWRQGCFPIG
jgi:hypothetical protein